MFKNVCSYCFLEVMFTILHFFKSRKYVWGACYGERRRRSTEPDWLSDSVTTDMVGLG